MNGSEMQHTVGINKRLYMIAKEVRIADVDYQESKNLL